MDVSTFSLEESANPGRSPTQPRRDQALSEIQSINSFAESDELRVLHNGVFRIQKIFEIS